MFSFCGVLRRIVNNTKDKQTFKFNGVFPPDCTQEQVCVSAALQANCPDKKNNKLRWYSQRSY